MELQLRIKQQRNVYDDVVLRKSLENNFTCHHHHHIYQQQQQLQDECTECNDDAKTDSLIARADLG